MVFTTDWLTLDLAIYFIAPVILIAVVGFVAGVFLCVSARVTSRIEVPLQVSTTTMAGVFAAGAGLYLLLRWLDADGWIAIVAGGIVSYGSCVAVCSKAIKRPDKKPIGFCKATTMSSVLALFFIAVALLVSSAG